MKYALIGFLFLLVGCTSELKRQPAGFPLGGRLNLGSKMAYVETANSKVQATCTQFWLAAEQAEIYAGVADSMKSSVENKDCPRDNVIGFCETESVPESTAKIYNQMFYYKTGGYTKQSARAGCSRSNGKFYTFEP